MMFELKMGRIRGDWEERFGQLLARVERHNSDLLRSVLRLNTARCRELFGVGNETLEECECLVDLILIGLSEEGGLFLERSDNPDGYRVTFMMDDTRTPLSERSLNMILGAIESEQRFIEKHQEAIGTTDKCLLRQELSKLEIQTVHQLEQLYQESFKTSLLPAHH